MPDKEFTRYDTQTGESTTVTMGEPITVESLSAEIERRICHHALYHEVCSMGGNDPCPHQAEVERLKAHIAILTEEGHREIGKLRAICREWLPIIERQFASLPPAPDSLGWQTALHRVERLRAACQ